MEGDFYSNTYPDLISQKTLENLNKMVIPNDGKNMEEIVNISTTAVSVYKKYLSHNLLPILIVLLFVSYLLYRYMKKKPVKSSKTTEKTEKTKTTEDEMYELSEKIKIENEELDNILDVEQNEDERIYEGIDDVLDELDGQNQHDEMDNTGDVDNDFDITGIDRRAHSQRKELDALARKMFS